MAAWMICEKNIGDLLITEGYKLVEIFIERDYVGKLILAGKSSKDTPIGNLMTKNPFTVIPDNTIADCMNLMTDKHIRHLLVEDDGRLIGMISIGDVVKQIIADQKTIIQQLESYITM